MPLLRSHLAYPRSSFTASCSAIAVHWLNPRRVTGLLVVALGGALLGYFVYSPTPEIPRLSGKLIKGTLEVDGLRRTYLTYIPQEVTRGTPFVGVMHGSGQNSAQTRRATGYGFERLPDQHGFAVVYADAYEGYWNACNIVGDYGANKLDIDDVGF